jgi:hypothetical protein
MKKRTPVSRLGSILIPILEQNDISNRKIECYYYNCENIFRRKTH